LALQHNSYSDADGEATERDDAKSVAESLLSTTSSIRQVHSKKSLTAVIERAKKRSAETNEGGEGGAPSLPKVEPPVIVVLNEFGEGLADKKKLVSQIPYMNRNPAV
jgi:hypothetical protein